jgi:hypothetical protein
MPKLRGKVAAGGLLNAYRAVRGAVSAAKAGRRGLRVRMRLRPRQRLAVALRRGVRMRTGCSRACSLRVELALGRRVRGASRRGAGRRWLDAGRTWASFSRAGQLALSVRVRRGMKHRLRTMKRVRLEIRAVAVDEARGRSALIKRVTLVR